MKTALKISLRLLVQSLIVCTSFIINQNVLAINVADVAAGGVTPAMLTSILQGNGVTISNLTVTKVPGCNSGEGVGVFTQGTSPTGPGPVLGVPTGVIISNGAFNAASNPLNAPNNRFNSTNILCAGAVSDPDMVSLESQTARGEYSAIEFDVVPQSTTLTIPFQFGSDEFPEYVCTQYNDVVGIFVSGSGINGPYSNNAQNYAKTSTGDPSSINWVNTGVVGQYGTPLACGSLANAAYYTDNSNGNLFGGNAAVATTNTNLQLDGYTNTLYQPIPVVPGQTYHVKIAVADAGDRVYDSTAFIQPLFSSGTFAGFDFGDAPDSYQTLTSSGGASHGISSAIFMGNVGPDSEITGQPSVNADGDDLNGVDDEDGVSTFPTLTTAATSYSVNVKVTNTTGKSARLVGWIDFNNNGRFDPAEGTTAFVPSGISGGFTTLTWNGLNGLAVGRTYVRLRLSTDINLSTLSPGNTMFDGEVEDYPLTISGVNFTKFVSTNATCNDTLTALTVAPGTSIYFCYRVSNPNAQSFVIAPGKTSDNQGHNLSALEQIYAPLTSKTVVVGPIPAGSAALPNGVTTVNTAQVTATISGTNVTVIKTASLTVSNNPPAAGIKQLYLDNLNSTQNLTRVIPTTNTRTGNFGGGSSVTINQTPVFQAPFSITGGSTVNVQLWLRNRNGGGNRTARVELYNGKTGTLIGSNSQSWSGRRFLTFPINVVSSQNFSIGDFVRIVITNTSANGRNIRLNTLRNGNNSQLQMQTTTVVNVNSIAVYAAAYPALNQFTSYTLGSSIFIRATTSDPFGNADISSATITITDAANSIKINNALMTSVATPTGATRIFEYPYTLPTTPSGWWNIRVTANEGSEGTISHTAQTTMIVGTTNLSISKNSAVLSDPVNATMPKSIPNAIIEYTIKVKNSGFGYMDANSFVLTDPLPAATTFYFGSPLNPVTFIDGTTPSGLNPVSFINLASTTDDIDFSNNGGSTFITPQVDANGFDITVPPINFIRITPKGVFKGSDGTNHPSMEIKFRVRLN